MSVVEPSEALDRPSGELPWIVESSAGRGLIDERAEPESPTTDAGYLAAAFGEVDLSDEWETDQLAALGEEEEAEGEEAHGPPAPSEAAGQAPPVTQAAAMAPELQESSSDQDDSPADAFDSDAEMFVKLLDELEASARAESARIDAGQSTGPRAAPAAREAVPAPQAASGPDAVRVEEIASRLERIARSLRERGPAGPLADEGVDPLGAMVAGYLLGLSERPIEGVSKEDPERR